MTEPHPEELLAAYVDGEATADERRAVEAHLASCSACVEDVALARRAVAALQALEEIPAPWGLATAAIQHSKPQARWVRRTAYATAGAAAAALIAVFAVTSLTAPPTGTADSPGQVTDIDAGTGGDDGAEGGEAVPLGATTGYFESDADYSQDELRERARAFTLAESQADSADRYDSPAARDAIECIGRAGLTAGEGAQLISIESARFEGDTAYIVLFLPDRERLEIWVIDRQTCAIRYVANAR